MLYERHNYLDRNIQYLTSHEIIEYDIQSAGFNLIKRFGLVDEYKVRRLEALGKTERQIQIGLYQREDKSLSKRLNEKFKEVRGMFFKANNIADEDVLSIKKDAIIMLRRCDALEFDNIQFVEKNVYSSFYYLNRYEFYLGDRYIDVKGISDGKLEFHKDYMLDFLYTIFKMLETTSPKIVSKNIKEFSFYYKGKHLDVGYYRELNSDSLYRLHETLFGKPMGLQDTGCIDEIDISYNYLRYIIPIVSLII